MMKKEYDLSKLKKRPGKVKSDPEAAKTPDQYSPLWICLSGTSH